VAFVFVVFVFVDFVCVVFMFVIFIFAVFVSFAFIFVVFVFVIFVFVAFVFVAFVFVAFVFVALASVAFVFAFISAPVEFLLGKVSRAGWRVGEGEGLVRVVIFYVGIKRNGAREGRGVVCVSLLGSIWEGGRRVESEVTLLGPSFLIGVGNGGITVGTVGSGGISVGRGRVTGRRCRIRREKRRGREEEGGRKGGRGRTAVVQGSHEVESLIEDVGRVIRSRRIYGG
jgi:hypothetical protein